MSDKLSTTLDILGTEYTLVYKELEEDVYLQENKGIEAYTDYEDKKIVFNLGYMSDKELSIDGGYHKATIRHEIVHAFLYESGLDVCSEWARNEEMVDWIAIQLPKMIKAMDNYI